MLGNIVSLSILVLAIIVYFVVNKQYNEMNEQLNQLEELWERKKAALEGLYKTVKSIKTLSAKVDITDIPSEEAPEVLMQAFMKMLEKQIAPYIVYDNTDKDTDRQWVRMSITVIEPM